MRRKLQDEANDHWKELLLCNLLYKKDAHQQVLTVVESLKTILLVVNENSKRLMKS